MIWLKQLTALDLTPVIILLSFTNHEKPGPYQLI